ncbi:hypothetical protein Bhyg_06749 [Pseudolycoriella hygida]|uniref:Uncharacterized protein n=1 Tax=Pseudolycoriella hygida TaxID=35572 RepID=A0A9Q0N1W8_9DIPT|nr:hypothetical protein Bhyg_06749 [Pseudolycoriella hygida]
MPAEVDHPDKYAYGC